MRSHSSLVSRARPLLGTLVEVGAWGGQGVAAVESAFEAIARVERLMSVHDRDSDLGRANREAHERPVAVHAWTAEVLRFSLRLRRESAGVFDCGVGRSLERAGFLPAGTAHAGADDVSCREGVIIDASNRVRYRRPLCIDLGGVAKGYAVDRAIEALQVAGVTAGIVNAGGDLRAFGLRGFPIQVRDPSSPGRLARICDLRSGAVATSSGCHTSGIVEGRPAMPIFDPLRRRFLPPRLSVSVTAPTCMAADALTKVAAILGPGSRELLERYDAHAMWWEGGRISATWEAACPRAA
jgi:thiamine biosynthesis lipoprotein